MNNISNNNNNNSRTFHRTKSFKTTSADIGINNTKKKYNAVKHKGQKFAD